MTYYNESLSARILDLLNCPIVDRCTELAMLFERCTNRDLQEVFPYLVKSIFGCEGNGIGWGLRATTKENSPIDFNSLYQFFAPNGPLFRLCYRLLNDGTKFEFNVHLLPPKIYEMIQSGQYSIFYADLLNVDPFRRKVTSLTLNAFDYFVLHFAIHATIPIHRMFPAALQVHNERTKSVYFLLSIEYFTTFLPTHPDAVVMPTNICPSVKAPQPMPMPPLQPKRAPRYLKIPNSSLFSNNPQTADQAAASLHVESPRVHAWRTESVLHFFVDIWLRYDVNGERDLPSSEFVRVARLLIKHIHYFGNSAIMDRTAMAALRKIAQPMIKTLIYPLLRSLIDRWPLDSSLSVVLELWLTYIQPWRYTLENEHKGGMLFEATLDNRFFNFIEDNLVVYTQIFVQILPRFERLDYTLFRNTIMLHRLVKVLTQKSLPEKLFQVEQTYTADSSYGYESPKKHAYFSPPRCSNTSIGSSNSSGIVGYCSDREEVYKPMFTGTTRFEIENFVNTVHIARIYIIQEISTLKQEIQETQQAQGFFRNLLNKILKEISLAERKLEDLQRIPEILELAIHMLSTTFNVILPEISTESMPRTTEPKAPTNLSFLDNSDYLDISKISPTQMMNNMATFRPSVDPALLPIQSNEFTFLVRTFHQLSCKINETFGADIQRHYNRRDFVGKLLRQILYAPITIQFFDKSRGFTELLESQLPARLCLRPLASVRVLFLQFFSLMLGYAMCNSPLVGILCLFLFYVSYVFVLAMIS